MSYCSACGTEVEPGALRCRDCGTPFAGPDRKPRLQPAVRIGADIRATEDGLEVDGFGVSFGFEPDEPDEPAD
jgi:hypothetical protein